MRLRAFNLKTPVYSHDEIGAIWENLQRSLNPMPVGMHSHDGARFELVYLEDVQRARSFFHTSRETMH